MDCEQARDQLLDLRRGRLEAAGAEEVRGHLAGCEGCRREAEAEALLDQALAERLPRLPASLALRRRLEALVAGRADGRAPSGSAGRARRLLAPALAAALALLSTALLVERQARIQADEAGRLAGELVSDHLRQLASAHPLDLESSATHEVKPWFEGRLDFAPAVPPDGGDLRLLGGSVGYVLDRKAAVISYAVRRHRVTLLAFPAAGLRWPDPDRTLGGVPVRALSQRGFSVQLWRVGELGYALVSDMGAEDRERVAAGLAAATAR
jgi:anti-sigma factor RsiW